MTMRGRLIVLCGLPGSGKTTLAASLRDTLGAVCLNTDEWMCALGLDLFDEDARVRVDRLQKSLAVDLVGAGATVVYESGGWSRVERDELRDAARATGAAVELRFLDVPVDVLWERVSRRNADLPVASAVIERDDLVQWSRTFERPDTEELGTYDSCSDEGAP